VLGLPVELPASEYSLFLVLVRLTSSSEVVDRRWAVRSGDFCRRLLRGVSSASEGVAELIVSGSSFVSSRGAQGSGGVSSARGVVTDSFDCRWSVKERVEALRGIDWSRSAVKRVAST
jgi:hypothetical protein